MAQCGRKYGNAMGMEWTESQNGRKEARLAVRQLHDGLSGALPPTGENDDRPLRYQSSTMLTIDRYYHRFMYSDSTYRASEHARTHVFLSGTVRTGTPFSFLLDTQRRDEGRG